ncbi:MAG TPA: lipopolysaccharide biosynthesis protein [Daejeonella sp.]|uniref:lipopolysaccharide biosynthesis protein n=1 Tax=Daejeonella sp. TaxID=2805397 RepID=UPI002ED97A85
MNSVHSEVEEISITDLVLKLKEWWRFLLYNWIYIAIAGVIGGGIGLIYANSQKPGYIAELNFALEDAQSQGGLGGYAGLASMVGVDLGGSGGGAFSGENLIEFMKSRAMIEKTLLSTIEGNSKSQTLANLYIDINQYRKSWEDDPKLKEVQFLPLSDRTKFTRSQDSILGKFYKDLIKNNLTIVKKDKKIGIISVIVNSGSETFSKAFAQTLVKKVSEFYIETKTKKSVDNLAILQYQTDSVRRALNSAFSGVASAVDLNPNPNLSRQVLRVPQQVRQVDIQANQAILTQLVTNLEIAKVSLRKETPLIQIIDNPILPLEVTRFGKLKGIILGGFIAGFIAVCILVMRKIFR